MSLGRFGSRGTLPPLGIHGMCQVGAATVSLCRPRWRAWGYDQSIFVL